jgi:dTDP-4-amino-4,6-dideoxygalactose transaminase
MIPFNKPFMTGKELDYIQQAVALGKISGDGIFSRRCQTYFEQRFGFAKTLLTTSCTDALEMAAILCDVAAGDEVIVPSYTFVSTANAFVLRGAKICFADSGPDHPNIDPSQIDSLINKRTKVIVPVHYAGTACEMGQIMMLAESANVQVVEDAAQAIDSYYCGKPLGTFGALSAFSFHETKNVIAGEGGLIAINDSSLLRRAEIIREKGTNRSAFFRGEVDKYGWVDIGSSFLPSEITSAFLLAQLESVDRIQTRRQLLWDTYYDRLMPLEKKGILRLPLIPSYATNNAHMFYIVCDSLEVRTNLIQYLKEHNIMSVFHYQPLHRSPFYAGRHDGRPLPNADRYADTLLRLPMYHDLKSEEVDYICERLSTFFTR